MAGYSHPPTVAVFSFVEVDFKPEVFEAYEVVSAACWVGQGVVVLAVVEAFDEVPESLGYCVEGLPMVIVQRVGLEDADASRLVTHASIAHHLTELFAIESVGRWRTVGRGVALAYGAKVDAEHVGIADEGFGPVHVALHFAKAVGVEFQVVHQLHVVLPYEVGLVTYVGMEEEVVGGLHDDVAEPGARGCLVVVFKVETGVDGGDVHDAVHEFVAFVDGECEVLATAKQYECVATGDNFFYHFC